MYHKPYKTFTKLSLICCSILFMPQAVLAAELTAAQAEEQKKQVIAVNEPKNSDLLSAETDAQITIESDFGTTKQNQSTEKTQPTEQTAAQKAE